MNWNFHDMNGWGWFASTLSMVLFWAVLVAVGVLLYRTLNRDNAAPRIGRTPSSATPEELLAQRFARGELDEDEYRHLLAVLRENAYGCAKYAP